MKKLLYLALCLVSCATLPSCTTTEGALSPAAKTVVSLGSIGLSYAALKGTIRPGDLILITDGLAVVRSPQASVPDKFMSLTELGLAAAVAQGRIRPGEAILIQEGAATLVRDFMPSLSPPPAVATSAKAVVEL